ncbi:MAG TPA: class I SAM-dependent methyltransferase [Bacteroides sp.]|nr:class I SAM-dependent methyltransferase [Bacteroides sp.]
MGIYSKYILPRAIDWACRNGNSQEQREKVIPLAWGNVLEIGIGAGHSLPLYDKSKVNHLTAIDPLEKLWKKRKTDLADLEFEVEYIRGTADHIPAGDSTYDSVVVTYTLCSIRHIDRTLQEVHRVLKPGGKLVFSEHGLAPDRGLRIWQNLINPLWKRIGGGCHLNRDVPAILERNGFSPDNLQTGYFPGWGPTSYLYWGSASRINECSHE